MKFDLFCVLALWDGRLIDEVVSSAEVIDLLDYMTGHGSYSTKDEIRACKLCLVRQFPRLVDGKTINAVCKLADAIEFLGQIAAEPAPTTWWGKSMYRLERWAYKTNVQTAIDCLVEFFGGHLEVVPLNELDRASLDPPLKPLTEEDIKQVCDDLFRGLSLADG